MTGIGDDGELSGAETAMASLAQKPHILETINRVRGWRESCCFQCSCRITAVEKLDEFPQVSSLWVVNREWNDVGDLSDVDGVTYLATLVAEDAFTANHLRTARGLRGRVVEFLLFARSTSVGCCFRYPTTIDSGKLLKSFFDDIDEISDAVIWSLFD